MSKLLPINDLQRTAGRASRGASAALAALVLLLGMLPNAQASSRLDVNSIIYHFPPLTLHSEAGEPVELASLEALERPLVLNFIFTSCSAICPTLSGGMVSTLKSMREQGIEVQGISVSIDPLNDTPRTLATYKQKFGSPADWTLLTGDLDHIRTVQRAFDAWRGNKMNHAPLTFLRPAPGEPWLRVSGFATAAELSTLLSTKLAGAQ